MCTNVGTSKTNNKTRTWISDILTMYVLHIFSFKNNILQKIYLNLSTIIPIVCFSKPVGSNGFHAEGPLYQYMEYMEWFDIFCWYAFLFLLLTIIIILYNWRYILYSHQKCWKWYQTQYNIQCNWKLFRKSIMKIITVVHSESFFVILSLLQLFIPHVLIIIIYRTRVITID